MLLGVFVESAFWTFALQIFILTMDLTSKTNFSDKTFTVFGFIVCYVFMFVVIGNLRYTTKNSA